MGISRRKAGTVVRCPSCTNEVIVPQFEVEGIANKSRRKRQPRWRRQNEIAGARCAGEGERPAEFFLDQGEDADGIERLPPQLEEVVGDADVGMAQDLFPNLLEAKLHRVRRRHPLPPRLRGGVVLQRHLGEGLPIDLPVVR